MKKRDFKSILMLIKQHIMKRDELAVLPKTTVTAKDMGANPYNVRDWDRRNTVSIISFMYLCVILNLCDKPI